MTITIQLQTAEELKLLQPLLQLLQKTNAEVLIQDNTAVSDTQPEYRAPEKKNVSFTVISMKDKQQGVTELLEYAEEAELPTVNKIVIPSREERNAR